jgi:pilus assembly protein CpaF
MATVHLGDSVASIAGRLHAPEAGHPGFTDHPGGPVEGRQSDALYLRGWLLEVMDPDDVRGMSESQVRIRLRELVDERIRDEASPPDHHQIEDLLNVVVDELLGYGPIGGLLRENEISEILVNGPRQVFVERRGQLSKSDVVFRDEEHLQQVILRMAAQSGRRIDRSSPMLDARLPDGSRLNAVLNPPALNGPLISIRRFGVRPLTIDDLLNHEALTKEIVDFLSGCVKGRLNILVAGGTGSGKTTLLNALSRFIPHNERVVTIEDTAELELQQPHVAKMESQPADLEGVGEVTMRDLVRNALRMRPDRIIVGECRGGEAFDMLQAMSTGHEGSMTTIHAGSPREAMARVELIVSLAGMNLQPWAVRKLIAASINVVVQVARLPGGKRRVTSIAEVTGMEGDTISMHDIFNFVQTGVHASAGAEGYFASTGIRPQFLNRLKVRGAELPNELFIERRLNSPNGRGLAR